MSIRVEKRGDKVKVETDYPAADIDHSVIQDDRELRVAMSNYGIDKIETPKSESGGGSSDVRYEFDDQYKKKYGHRYFGL